MKAKTLFAVAATLTAVALHAEFKAGFAKVDVTPEKGTPISGYYMPRYATGTLDPLYARCVAFCDGETRALLYSVDNLHLCQEALDQVRAEIVRRTGVPGDAVFFACTHTHTGASSKVPYGKSSDSEQAKKGRELIIVANKLMADGCAEAGLKALADLAEADMLIGRGEAKGISFIRRFRMKNGTQRTNPGRNNPMIAHPIGEPDEQLQVVRFVRQRKKDIAVINFQTHPDTIGGTLFSADWPGLTCTYFERAMDGQVEALFVNGAQGDTNHICVDPAPGAVIPARYEMAKHMARVVSGAALSVWGTCVPAEAGKVRAAIRQVKVEVNKGTPEEVETAKKYVEYHKTGRSDLVPGGGDAMERTANIAAAYRMLEVKDLPDKITLPVSVITIGRSLAFGGYPGEPFTTMGTDMKNLSPFTMTVPACCANGARGYFPVASAYGKGGYENATSRFKAGTAERLVEGVVAQLKEFHGQN